jgi:hypothetical protein
MVGYWWMRDYDRHAPPTIEQQEARNASLYILIDGYTFNELEPWDLWFLDDEPWQQVGAWCADPEGEPTLRLYTSGIPER